MLAYQVYGVYEAIVVAETTVGLARLSNVGAATAESTAPRKANTIDERMNMTEPQLEVGAAITKQ